MSLDTGWLPKCLSHLSEPYSKNTDQYVLIGELSDEPIQGYAGLRQLHTILVPDSRLEDVLKNPGGVGWEVESVGSNHVADAWDTCGSWFWVEGPEGRGDKLEPIVVSWDDHNKTVMMPDNAMLQCYRLCPRTTTDPDQIIWDDLSRPEYDVVLTKPLSHCDTYSYSGANIQISRRYLEDYASLKNCSVVAVFFEQRQCEMDDELAAKFNGKEWVSFEKPGYRLEIIQPKFPKEFSVLCKIWGCCLILTPQGRPISEEADLELEWPDYSGIMTYDRARGI